MNFKPLTIEDKDLIEFIFSKNNILISEYTFTNLFAWSQSRNVIYDNYKNGLIFIAKYENDRYFLPPIGYDNIVKITNELKEYGTKNEINHIKRIKESDAAILINENFNLIEDRNNFDYLYDSNEMGLLNGKKYSSKRNLYLNFINDYDFEFVEYEKRFENRCLEISKKWIESKNLNDKSLFNEYKAINFLIENYSLLSAKGYVLLINGRVEGFVFGEKLNDDTNVVHFEKANSDFRGIYQAINKLYIEKEVLGKYKFLNREQDLGSWG